MLRVRVVSPTPADAEAVSAQLVARGFDVVVASADVPSGDAVDFELHLERSTIQQAVLRAGSQRVPQMLVVAPGLLARREIAIPKVACQRENSFEPTQLAATGTYGAGAAPAAAVTMITSGPRATRASGVDDSDTVEARFLAAVRQSQFEAMRGFAAPAERNRDSVLMRAVRFAVRVCQSRWCRNLTVALGRATSLAAAYFGSISSR